MKRRPLTKRACLAAIVVAGACASTVFARSYAIAPPGVSVRLQPGDFISYVPQQSPWLPVPNSVVGDNIGQHPGAFKIGFPDVGTYFVGVFGHGISPGEPKTSIYLPFRPHLIRSLRHTPTLPQLPGILKMWFMECSLKLETQRRGFSERSRRSL